MDAEHGGPMNTNDSAEITVTGERTSTNVIASITGNSEETDTITTVIIIVTVQLLTVHRREWWCTVIKLKA